MQKGQLILTSSSSDSLRFFVYPDPKGHSRQPNVGIGIKEIKKVSPPFEGGVAGIIDYMIVTALFPGQGG
jgi:hypothetical protein